MAKWDAACKECGAKTVALCDTEAVAELVGREYFLTKGGCLGAKDCKDATKTDAITHVTTRVVTASLAA